MASFISIERLIEGPISLEPFQTPVSLIPCMHKIEQENAEALFGKLKQNSWKFNQVKKGGCPLCRQDVSGYAIDHTFQTLVFSLDSQTLNSFATLPHKAQPTFKLIKAAPHEASISTLFQQLFCC